MPMPAENQGTAGRAKPYLSFWQIWNMCFGFLGLQFGFALQNANVSRIFQTLGAGLEQIPLLWIAAPFTGLLVQPLIGYLSDRTWTRLGRRRPYFLGGAVLAATALVLMPRSLNLWMAAALLWLLDAAINVSMEPFRAFVGDQLNPDQRPAGYSMQSFFIGVGAVVASMLPWLLDRAGVSNHTAAPGGIPDTVRYAFEIGAGVLLLAIAWTTLRSREYPPPPLPSTRGASAARVSRGVSPALPGSRWLPCGGWIRSCICCVPAHCCGVSRSGCTAAGFRQGCSPASWAIWRPCRRRCGVSRRCSFFPGWRCFPCGSIPPQRWPRCTTAAAILTRLRSTGAPTGWACCSQPITALPRSPRPSFP